MSSRWFQPRAKICVAANWLRSGSRKRSKEIIGTVRHPYLLFDIDREAGPTSLRASDTVPTPTAFLSTSLGKYQTPCRVDSFTFEQESTLKLLAIPFGGDLTCDCNRVLRMPKFRNCKYDQPYPVTVMYPSDSTLNPGDFRLDIPAANAIPFASCNPIAKALRQAHKFRTRLGLDSARTCPRRGCRETDANACSPPLGYTPSRLFRPAGDRCRIGQTLPHRRHSDEGRCHAPGGPPSIRDCLCAAYL